MWSILLRIINRIRGIMNPETTNRLSIDTDQDVPRVIKKGTISVTTSTVPTAGWVSGSSDTVLSDITSSTSPVVDVIVKDNQTNLTYASPVQTMTSVGVQAITIGHYIYQTGQKLSIHIDIASKGGATSNTFTCYYIVYSTKINSDLTLTS